MSETDPTATARNAGRSARRAVVGPERDRAERGIRDRLLAVGELGPRSGGFGGSSGSVALYAPVDGEVDLTLSVDPLRERGWRLWLPVVASGPAGKPSLELREWMPGDLLDAGTFNVAEPPDDGRSPSTFTEMDVVVAPCTAVDEAGTRVGFGGGYYDRALGSASPRPAVVVVAFEAQVSRDPLPRRPWDVPADVVLTDARTLRPRG